jgi:Tfp pilus assembly protein FimT
MIRRKRNNVGSFTLLEVFIVCILLAIIAALVIPFAMQNDKMVALSAARAVVADMGYARDEACRRQAAITVRFDVTAETYQLTDSAGLITNPSSLADYTVNLPDLIGSGSLDIQSVNFGGGSNGVTFTATGVPVQADDNNVPVAADSGVVVRQGDYNYKVSVAPVTGKIRIASSP